MLLIFATFIVINEGNAPLKLGSHFLERNAVVHKMISRVHFPLITECGIWNSTRAMKTNSSFSLATQCFIKGLLLHVDGLQKQKWRQCSSSLTQSAYLSGMASLESNNSNTDPLIQTMVDTFMMNSDQATRKFAILLLKSGLKLRYDSALIDESVNRCGWNVATFAHDSASLPIPITGSGLNMLEASDAITFGTNLEGNHAILPHTCAIAFSGGNDIDDSRGLYTLMEYIGSASSSLDQQQIDKIRGNFTALISGLSFDIYHPAWKEYQIVKSALSFHNWLSLANSSDCDHLLYTGISIGAMLSQIHRIDFGDVNAFGKYIGTCLGGKPCRLIGILPVGGFWFGKVPEFDECSDSAMLLAIEQDPVVYMLPLAYQSLNQPVKDSLGIHSWMDIKNIKIEWRTKNQVWKVGRFKPQVMSFQVPCNMPFLEFTSSALYQDRLSYINSWGPLVSQRLCLQISFTFSSKYCSHNNMLNFGFLQSMLQDEKLGNFWIEYNFEVAIPDLSGSVFSALIR